MKNHRTVVALFLVLFGSGCGDENPPVSQPVVAPPAVEESFEESFPTKPVPISVLDEAGEVRIDAGELRIVLRKKPWRLTIRELGTDKVLLSEPDEAASGAWGRLAFGKGSSDSFNLYPGYLFTWGEETIWYHASDILSWSQIGNTAVFEIGTTDPAGRTVLVALEDFRERQFTLRAKVTPAGGINRIGMTFQTDGSEGFFGFGERFNAGNQRGRVIHSWAEEGSFSLGSFGSTESLYRFPGGSASTYYPVPFFISSRGYGVELDTTYRSTFDLAKGKPDAYRFQVETDRAGVTFYMGANPAQSLGMFTELRGRPLIPPKWTFGPWNQMSGQVEGKSLLEIADEYIDRDIPSSCRQGYVHFFPEGAELGQEAGLAVLNQELHARGLKSTCYFNPYVGIKHPVLFPEGSALGYFCLLPSGIGPYLFPYMNFLAAQVDFTNPDAKAWYQAQLKRALEMGFDGWMYDFGEYTPVDALFHDGRKGREVHNQYPVLYQQALFEFLQSVDPDPSDAYAPDVVPYVRSGYTGTPKYTWAHWTGDPSSDWSYADGLPAQIPAGLSVGLSGTPFSGSDIGGFAWYVQPPPSEELWIRWTQLGCFSGIMRDQTGGLGKGPKTQVFDFPEAIRVWRKYAKLRTALFPYLYTLAHRAHKTGLPIMRHHLLHFPDDPKALEQTYQYMFGDRFLVAPVVNAGQTKQKVYLPGGEDWIDVGSSALYRELDGRFRIVASPLVAGGQMIEVAAPADVCPLFVRAGSIIPTLDPSVDTLNGATDPRVTTLAQRAHLLHLWIWPNAAGKAAGLDWDGGVFSLEGSTLLVQGKPDTTIIAQVALGSGPAPTSVSAQTGSPLPQAADWRGLIETEAGTSKWAWDGAAGVLWLRLAPGDHQATWNY